MVQNLRQEELITSKSQLLEPFYNSFKSRDTFKVGIELEKLGVNRNTCYAVPYSGSYGIHSFFEEFKNTDNWEYITENDSILGLRSGCNIITLEPGSQFELSNCPHKTIHSIYDQIAEYNHTTAQLAEDFDIYWLGYGIQPLSTYENIELIPKRRYDIMNEYLPTVGRTDLIMMRETAGIQVAVDFDSEIDAIRKLKLALSLSPIVSAIFSNSPIRAGKDTGYKSFRAYGWVHTDKARCGFISRKLFEEPEFTFSDYVDVLLDLPMIFMQKGETWSNMRGLTFREYLKNGYEGYQATIDDWNLHMSSFFPEVRLRNYLEIRNADCQGTDLIPSIPALWKGIMYNDEAFDAASSLIEIFNWEDLNELRHKAPKYALDTEIRDMKLADLAKELVNIALYSLKLISNLNEKGQDEAIYLDALKDLVSQNKTPADKILDYWHGSWDKDIRKLVEYTRLT